MKTLYQVIASTILLTTSLTTANTQDLSSSASRNSRGERYQNRGLDDEFEVTTSVHANDNSESLTEQVQGYSHGLEFHSSSNSLNMMECVKISEESATATIQIVLIKPKYVRMSKVLSLSNQEAETFFPVYARYESELTALTNITSDFERLLEQQQVLKEKFFDEMNQKSGSYLATRFLAWENYYSNTCAVK